MSVMRITEENISVYRDYIPEDMAENIGRVNFRGLVYTRDGEPEAGMVWELIMDPYGNEKRAKIRWLDTVDEEAGDIIFSDYDDEILNELVTVSSFELPAKSCKTEKETLRRAGFSVALSEGDRINARLSELADISPLKKKKIKGSVQPLENMTQRGFNQVTRRLSDMGRYGRCEDLEYLPRFWFDQSVSCYSENDGMTDGIFLCHQKPCGRLIVEMMYAMGKDSGILLTHLMAKALEKANEKYDPETEIVIDRHNYATLALGEKLFPRSFGLPVYIGERNEL